MSGVEDVIKKFADQNGLPRDWMNSDFVKTVSYSNVLSEVSKHYYTLNNGTLEIRTVSGVYLIAMKLRSHRDYRNDISDVIGVLMEEMESGNAISFDDIQNAYIRLYNDKLPDELTERMRQIGDMSVDELKTYFEKQNVLEQEIGGKIVTYINEGANINTRNVDDVIARIKEKMKNGQDT